MRYTKFGQNFSPGLIAQAQRDSTRVEIFTPTRGFHRGDAPQDLLPGFSPDAYNFEGRAGHIRPRSGLSQYKGGNSKLSGAALGAWRMQDTSAAQYLLGASNRTIVVYDPGPDAWSDLSYLRPSGWGSDYTASGTTRQPFEGAWIYDEGTDRNMGVLTNHVDLPFAFFLEPSFTTYSNLTDFLSLASKARSVCVFDNRLVWFNTASSASSYPQRVMWSARGLPRNYQIADGAGIEDLLDMSGIGTRIISESEGVLLFTDEEIWRGRKRGDAHVFDFYPIEKQFGAPYPRTIVDTPIGVIFLGRDLELYLVRGDSVVPIGPASEGEDSRVQDWLGDVMYEVDRAWAVYNSSMRRYELYYVALNSPNGYPARGLFFDVGKLSFWPQRFEFEVTAGADYGDSGTPLVWDNVVLTWDDIATTWSEQLEAGTGFGLHVFSSAGTNYRFRSTSTDDDGSAFTARWTSHGLGREESMRYDQLTDVFAEYKATSNSSCSFSFGDDFGFTNSQARSVSLPLGEYKRQHVTGFANGVAPHFRVEITDGSQVEFARFEATLRDSGIYGGGS